MPIYAIDQHIPVIDASSFIHPSAEIIGDVIIGAGCYIGPNAVIRGDFGRILIEENSNVQDTCVIHSFPGGDCILHRNSHVGHGAVLHGCILQPDCLIGMNAVIMDNCSIGAESIVGASSFVKANSQFDKRSLIVGTPAKLLRQVSDAEFNWKQKGTEEYVKLARRALDSLHEVTPLTQVEADRPRFNQSSHRPKS
ncbi:MAG: transferase hexapeptide repeat family protein [Pseudomonadales bacterium]|nr:transferase hexapeptide repeat family protein [Pseudomonadales bacterium]NRA17752.1 transferase hexapeptide repeat family protein [Oceanospirillaceae bacterium]